MPGNKCGGNKVIDFIDGLEVTVADVAICPNDSDVCCSEDEIDREWSDYSPDGYKCAWSCFDLPQDEPNESEQLSNISPFLPKEAKCPKGEHCCKKFQKPIPPVDLHWFFEVSISAFISNRDKNSVLN